MRRDVGGKKRAVPIETRVERDGIDRPEISATAGRPRIGYICVAEKYSSSQSEQGNQGNRPWMSISATL